MAEITAADPRSWTIERIAAELDKVTSDDIGTVQKLLESASTNPEVLEHLYVSPRGLEALALSPPQRAWLYYLQFKRDNQGVLVSASTFCNSLGEIFRATAGER